MRSVRRNCFFAFCLCCYLILLQWCAKTLFIIGKNTPINNNNIDDFFLLITAAVFFR